MARARNIKPGIYDNVELAECGAGAFVLFTGLWTLVDRYGVMKYQPKVIEKNICFLYDIPVTSTMLALCKTGMVRLYTVDGAEYLQVTNFHKHQHPHLKEQPRDFPHHPSCCCGWERCQHYASTIQAPDKTGTSTSDSLLLITDSLNLIPDTGLPALPEGDKSPAREKASKRCPENWEPKQTDVDTLLAEFPSITVDDIRRWGRVMRDHEFKSARKDWDAVFRNWIRSDASRVTKPTSLSPEQRRVQNIKHAMQEFANE